MALDRVKLGGIGPAMALGSLALLLAIIVGAAVIPGLLPAQVTSPPLPRRAQPLPVGVAANGRLATSQGGDIFIRETLMTTSRVVIDGDTEDYWPKFSNDGSTLAFARTVAEDQSELWIAAPDGSDPRRLAGPFTAMFEYRWAPDGEAIAVDTVTQDEPQRSSISIVPTDGGPSTILDVGMDASGPKWRGPDGDQLLFTGVDDAGNMALYLIDRDGSHLTHIDLDLGSDIDATRFLSGVAISPNGSKIAYPTTAVHPEAPDVSGMQIHVAEIGPFGEVLSDTTLPSPLGAWDIDPVFLPQGDRIVFERLSQTLIVAGVDGRTQLDLGVDADISSRLISPDGTRLLAWADQHPWFDAVDLATGERTTVGRDDPAFGIISSIDWQRLSLDP